MAKTPLPHNALQQVRSQKKAEIAQRRVEVADLLNRHIPHSEIARRLKVDPATITRDVKAIIDGWEEEVKDKIGGLRAREANALDHLELVAQMNMENAMALRQALEPKRGKDGAFPALADSQAWERLDRSAARWHDQRLRVQERRAKLLNLDSQAPAAPTVVRVPISFIQVTRPEAVPQITSGNGYETVEGEVIGDGGSD